MGRRVILASGSPRRKELLTKITEQFEVIVSECDETLSGTETPAEAVCTLSARKAMAVAALLQKREPDQEFMVIGSDTVVSLSGKILGKPRDEEDAVRMLSELSGCTHEVFTGVTVYLVDAVGIREHTCFSERTQVHVHQLSADEILAYVKSGEPMDKAGAYGIQGLASKFIDGISGDYFNVVGLPVARLYQEIKELI